MDPGGLGGPETECGRLQPPTSRITLNDGEGLDGPVPPKPSEITDRRGHSGEGPGPGAGRLR
ncbi:hypothetical protein GCM10010411_81680 [Actinomadura fulvescens]|uniref:Uncharacterized protein n=1 Tax=Actinomadura fulvescens TaxID=46160 RepID=A0ABP6D1K3_9ACTN